MVDVLHAIAHGLRYKHEKVSIAYTPERMWEAHKLFNRGYLIGYHHEGSRLVLMINHGVKRKNA